MFDLLGGDVTNLDAAGALTVATELRSTADLAESRLLQVAAHYADLHPYPGTSRGSGRLPGMERAKVYGGEGCPEVAEFAPIELGVALGISSGTAARLIGDALSLRHRLPRVWSRVLAGEVQAWRARQIASACWPLSEEAAALVDARVSGCAQEVTPYRLAKIVQAAVMEADPERAKAEAAKSAKARGVWVGQSDLYGTKNMVVKAAAGDVIRFDARVDQIADLLGELGDEDTKDLRRAKAIGWLANPHALQALLTLTHSPTTSTSPTTTGPVEPAAPDPAPESATSRFAAFGQPAAPVAPDAFVRPAGSTAPAATVYVHLTDETLANADKTGTGILRVGETRTTQKSGGLGPLLASQLAELLGDPRLIGKIVVKPVIDLADRIAVDAYEIPDRIRERLLLRYLTCYFPYCNRPVTPNMDLDHVVPYDDTGPPGQTSTETLGPGCRLHHRVKTHGGWTVDRLDDGAFKWTSPHGWVLRVDDTGTHPIVIPLGTPTTRLDIPIDTDPDTPAEAPPDTGLDKPSDLRVNVEADAPPDTPAYPDRRIAAEPGVPMDHAA